MDNEDLQYDRIIAFEITMAIIAILIILSVIVSNVFKDDYQTEEETVETLLIAQPISEETQPANPQQEPILSCKIHYIKEIVEVEEVVNPYTELIENLTEEEKTLIYKITFAEAGNQKEEGQRAVIEVILNRVLSDNFPNTVEEVLSQKSQFTTWKNRNNVKQVDQNRIIPILELVAMEEPVLPSTEYLFFARGKQTKYATDFIKIQDHWFGATK